MWNPYMRINRNIIKYMLKYIKSTSLPEATSTRSIIIIQSAISTYGIILGSDNLIIEVSLIRGIRDFLYTVLYYLCGSLPENCLTGIGGKLRQGNSSARRSYSHRKCLYLLLTTAPSAYQTPHMTACHTTYTAGHTLVSTTYTVYCFMPLNRVSICGSLTKITSGLSTFFH